MKFPTNAISYKVPAEIDPLHAVFVEPLACSIHAVERGEISFNDVVVIAGAGPLGIGMVAAAKLKSPRLLIALDLSDDRLGRWRRDSAPISRSTRHNRRSRRGTALTDGYGCDVYIEATGHRRR